MRRGTNNIPVDIMTSKRNTVFNTGANANSVKESVLCSLFLSARDIIGGIQHIQDLTDSEGFSVAGSRVEKDKKLFSGNEVKGKTLGVIGLGAIGSQVAMAGSSLGMEVLGYDPELTVESALNLDGNKIKRVNDIENCIESSDYISLHIPVIKGITENIINKKIIDIMKPGSNLINFSRGELVNHQDLLSADNKKFTGNIVQIFQMNFYKDINNVSAYHI